VTVPGGLMLWPVEGVGEITPSQDLGGELARALCAPGVPWRAVVDGDVVVVTQKVVSKAEGRLVEVDHEDPAAKRRLVEREARRVLRRRQDLLITETAQGFVCANSGVDLSNVAQGTAALLPKDADRSARRLAAAFRRLLSAEVAVVVSDTFGRPWRKGVTDVAIGCAGLAAVVDLRGTEDAGGRALVATEVCVADEVASAAELVMGKDRQVPAAVVRGLDPRWLRASSVVAEVVRPPAEDLFR
jgi:coenzyme F420-0:L-glutamate ligase/coenzyme F420-1:gamma-L-glutamate ligase